MFQLQKRLEKWRQIFVKNGLKISVFVKKLKILYILDLTIWFKFRQHVVQIRIKKCMESLDFQCQHLQRYHGRVLMTNLLQNWFSDRTLYVAITDADIGSIKLILSIYYLMSYLDHMLVKFEQIVWYEVYKILSTLAKNG